MSIKTGRYRHYKGNEYIVLGVARHSETEEELVVYRQDYGERSLWVRPRAMFEETVEVNGARVPRFEFVAENEATIPWRPIGSRIMAERLPDNLFADLPTALPKELVTILAENRHIRIERIISTGHTSPEGFWYEQQEVEWVVVLKGEAKLFFEGDEQPITMRPGDHRLIPAYRKHRVEWTTSNEPTVWLAVFFQD